MRWKTTERRLQTLAFIVLLVWSLFESTRFTRSVIDHLRGATDGCAARNAAHHRLYMALMHASDSADVTYDLRTRLPSAIATNQHARHRAIRRASSELRRISARTSCTSANVKYSSMQEWSIFARYPTDGPLLTISSTLGFRTRTIIEVDDARGKAGADVSKSFVALHGWRAAVARAAWSGARASRTRYTKTYTDAAPPLAGACAHISEADEHAPRAVIRTSRIGNADILAIFASHGQERAILSEANHAHARILLVAYRDFLGARDALWRNASAQAGVASALDPLRGAPIAGYSLRALADMASEFGFRLVWCLRRFPIALFVHQREAEAVLFFPTLKVGTCFAQRAQDAHFRSDMEALWDVAQGHKWSHVTAAVRAP